MGRSCVCRVNTTSNSGCCPKGCCLKQSHKEAATMQQGHTRAILLMCALTILWTYEFAEVDASEAQQLASSSTETLTSSSKNARLRLTATKPDDLAANPEEEPALGSQHKDEVGEDDSTEVGHREAAKPNADNVQWHTVHGTTSWTEAKKYCASRKKSLCLPEELCPKGGCKAPVGGPRKGDAWTAVLPSASAAAAETSTTKGTTNIWLQVGVADRHRMCYTHNQKFGPPAWGETNEMHSYRTNLACCNPRTTKPPKPRALMTSLGNFKFCHSEFASKWDLRKCIEQKDQGAKSLHIRHWQGHKRVNGQMVEQVSTITYGVFKITEKGNKLGYVCGCKESIMRYVSKSCKCLGHAADVMGSRYCPATNKKNTKLTKIETMSVILGCYHHHHPPNWFPNCDISPTFVPYFS